VKEVVGKMAQSTCVAGNCAGQSSREFETVLFLIPAPPFFSSYPSLTPHPSPLIILTTNKKSNNNQQPTQKIIISIIKPHHTHHHYLCYLSAVSYLACFSLH
jgi:hypothetical protein